ncbi:hypothetical protein [Paractinoplanes atraurantiacus]|uniref:Uncharacterized protein n=1 Tax=Paractinoplanes atraurantiacus TaxID=1036182 RepID=A0A285HRK9_9ACTN|nr:hypothetical protein [Actinoplanes atraurantiacus]SNY38400.1 hypothetical protein SAMN05421748_105216 [Actinoplanes atraurantiacus]
MSTQDGYRALGGYRALLAAYPARLRRKHGPELIETLLEMTAPGATPTRADQRRLVLDGLRERFRPPVRRPLALIAVIASLLVGGALGAAAGSWLGTLAYASLPQPTMLGFATGSVADHYVWGESRLATATDPRQATEQTRQKLATEGWATGPIVTGDGSDGILANVHFAAEADGVHLNVYAYPSLGTITIAGWPARPASYVPLTIAGTLLGLLAGWLAGVALAHRVRAARRPLPSTVLMTAGLLLVIPSAVGFVASLVRYLTVAEPLGSGELVHGHGFAFGPTLHLLRAFDLGEGWVLTPGDLQQLPLWGFALIAVAAGLARPRREPETRGVTAA